MLCAVGLGRALRKGDRSVTRHVEFDRRCVAGRHERPAGAAKMLAPLVEIGDRVAVGVEARATDSNALQNVVELDQDERLLSKVQVRWNFVHDCCGIRAYEL